MSLERECVRRRSGEEVVTAGGASFCFGDAGVNAKERREGSRAKEKGMFPARSLFPPKLTDCVCSGAK